MHPTRVATSMEEQYNSSYDGAENDYDLGYASITSLQQSNDSN